MVTLPQFPQYAVSPDGQQFLLPVPVEETPERAIHIIIQHWHNEFRDH